MVRKLRRNLKAEISQNVLLQILIGIGISLMGIAFVRIAWPYISHAPYSVLVLPVVGAYVIGGSALSGVITTLILMGYSLTFTEQTGWFPFWVFLATGMLVSFLVKRTKERIRVLSDAQIRAEEGERLKFAASAGRLGIWEWDILNDHLVWNDQMFEFYGVNRNSFAATVSDWENCLHPEDSLDARSILEEALKAKPFFSSSFRIIRPNGEIRHIQAEALMIRDSEGHPIKMFGLNRDITEEKKNIQKIQELHAYLETALEQSQAGIIIAEATKGEIRFANPASLKITDRPKSLVVDDIDASKYGIWGVADLEGNPLTGDEYPLLRAIKEDKFIKEELAIMRPSGEKRIVLVNAAPIRGKNGEIFAGIVIFLDITDQHQLLERVRLAQKQAEEAMQAKARFLDVAAHELRTPVTAVSLMLQLAERQASEGLSFEPSTLQRMKVQVDRLTRLVVDLLEVSKFDRGILELKYEWTDFGALITDCISTFKIQFSERPIHFSEPTVPVKLQMDPVRIYEVIANLIDNAIKYTPPESPLEISLESNSDQVYFAISDQGPGLSTHIQKRLFGAFERENCEPQKRYSGLGLGLFISRGIIELHGGTIGVRSQAGQGCTFFFNLPRTPALAKTGTEA